MYNERISLYLVIVLIALTGNAETIAAPAEPNAARLGAIASGTPSAISDDYPSPEPLNVSALSRGFRRFLRGVGDQGQFVTLAVIMAVAAVGLFGLVAVWSMPHRSPPNARADAPTRTKSNA